MLESAWESHASGDIALSIKWLIPIAFLLPILSISLTPYALADSTADSAAPPLRPELQTTVTTTTSTTTTTTKPGTVNVNTNALGGITVHRIRSNSSEARRLAKYHWLDKVGESNPEIIEAVARHHSAAIILAQHPRLGEIAEADHYLCRALTKWKNVARLMAQNGQADKVVALDPEGIYRMIKRDRVTARRLARNPMFDQMVNENPDLGKLIAAYM
jgi:hypothetical protein